MPSVVPTRTPPPSSTATLSPDLHAPVQTVVTALETDRPELLRALIGQEGVAVGGFAMGMAFHGSNNADEIVAAFADALARTTPVCEGLDPYAGTGPDKAILVYRGVELDRRRFGLGGEDEDAMTLQLFKLEAGWRLMFITPLDLEFAYQDLGYGPLQDCPTPQPP